MPPTASFDVATVGHTLVPDFNRLVGCRPWCRRSESAHHADRRAGAGRVPAAHGAARAGRRRWTRGWRVHLRQLGAKGATLDVHKWLTPKADGKPPAAIVGVVHLDVEECTLVLGVLLVEVLS